jgi:hypothetical protein
MSGTIEQTYLLERKDSMNLTTQEAADRMRLTVRTLANWRVRGDGPRFIKMGHKVLYPVVEIEAFEQRQLRDSTAHKRKRQQ